MSFADGVLFDDIFLQALRSLIATHHEVYPMLPPQGIFFEALVEQAFRKVGWPKEQVTLTTPNSPLHDLMVGTTRVSLKTETGIGTKANRISLTKLCTTEAGPWDSEALIRHTLGHLNRYDKMVLLRALWHPGKIRYQFLEIPLRLLRLLAKTTVLPVGRRAGRRSLGADVCERDTVLFHVHFDGADGKCQIRGLRPDRCRRLLEWDQPIVL